MPESKIFTFNISNSDEFDLNNFTTDPDRESNRPKEITEEFSNLITDKYDNIMKIANKNIISFADYSKIIEEMYEHNSELLNIIHRQKIHIDTKEKLIKELQSKIDEYQKIPDNKKQFLIDQEEKERIEEEMKEIEEIKKQEEEMKDNYIASRFCKDCIDYETGKMLDHFMYRFLCDFNYENAPFRKYVNKYVSDEKYQRYYINISDYKIISFANFYSKLIKDKVTQYLPYDRYFENSCGKWKECKQKDAYKIIYKEIEKHLSYEQQHAEILEIRNFIENTALFEWRDKKNLKENTYDSILALTFSYNFDLFKNGIININTVEIKEKKVEVSKNDDDKNGENKMIISDHSGLIRNFIEEKILKTNNKKDRISANELYNNYILWSNNKINNKISTKLFGINLRENNLESKHTNNGTVYICIKYK